LRNHLTRTQIIELKKQFQLTVNVIIEICGVIGTVLKRVADSPPSPGYEPWLIKHGCNPIAARGLGHIIVRLGNRSAQESARYPSVVNAVRFLAKPRRNRPARNLRIKLLLAAWDETSIIDTIFKNAKLDESEFLRSLNLAAEGNEDAYRRVTEIAADLAPHLTISRGPKISAASAAHELFLEEVSRVDPSRYTYRTDKEDFTDAVTAATRREFNDNDFYPQPAVRRLKTRSQAN
jgi:hypothetical protein